MEMLENRTAEMEKSSEGLGAMARNSGLRSSSNGVITTFG